MDIDMGKKPGGKENYLADKLKKKCQKREFQGIHHRSIPTRSRIPYSNIQKERTLHLVLRLRGETEHDTNDNVTTKTQSTFHTAHMNINT